MEAGADLSRVTAVVLVWNSGELEIKQLERLQPAFEAGLRMVLLDNGSVDGSFQTIERFLSGWPFARAVDLVRSDTNLGFCAGVNFATARAVAAQPQPEYIWMLNPDADVTRDTATELLTTLLESGAAVASPAGQGPRYIPESAWRREFWAPPRFCLAAVPAAVRWWPTGRYQGSCALFAMRAVDHLIATRGEFLDSALFMDADEWEASLRLRRAGFGVVLARDAVVHHPPGHRSLAKTQLSAARQYYQSRNPVIIAKRLLPGWQFWPLLALRIARDLSWFLRLRLGRVQSPHEATYLVGVLDALRGKTGRWSRHPDANR